MAVIKRYNPGRFCWTDLATSDAGAARKFYCGIFGWTVQDLPMGAGSAKYSILRVDGKDACALYPMSAEQKTTKAAPYWLPYIAVRNVDAALKKAKAAGGNVCDGPMDVMDKGRMAIIQDPSGATVAIWQAGTRRGAQLDDRPGTVSWHDLNTPKPAVAGKFYAKVFEWKDNSKNFSGNDYHLFTVGKKSIGGMWPAAMKKLPPSWLTYWNVSDCAKTVGKVKRLGGRVLMGTTRVPGMCSFAIVKDPQGAVFGLLQPEE